MNAPRISGICVAVVACLAIGCGKDVTPAVTSAIQQIVDTAPDGGDAKVQADVRQFYAQRGHAPAWLDNKGTATAEDALAVLRTAPNHGLVSTDYGERDLAPLIDAEEDEEDIDTSLKRDAQALARFDVELTTALVALGRDVALGRTTPGTISKNWKARRTAPDLVGTLSTAVASGRDIRAWLDEVRPVHPEYAALQQTLMAINDKQQAQGTPDPRAGQIALNMERWRWMPDDFGARHILVNVPAFYMAVRENGSPVLEMKVIVGTPQNATPIFSDQMETVVFSPYWNVPDSIAEGETAPSAARDPNFLRRQNIEILRRTGTGTESVDPASVNWDDPAAIKELAFRQKPGAKNALGHVKFLFPNAFNVYLHDTPADSLFSREGRALSHGCIRLERPEELAGYLLRDKPEWTDRRIKEAMNAGEEKHVALGGKLPVHIVYFTAWPKGDGDVELYDDIYGYDTKQWTAARQAGSVLMSRR
jgi:murein L,D-transpeptidase YcbB/YkuD